MARTLKRAGLGALLADPYGPTADRADGKYRPADNPRMWMIPAVVGGLLLVVALIGWVVDPHQFYFSYLVGWMFCVSISLGSLFFIVIQHLTRARWSVVIRRIAESLAMSMPLLAVLSIPVFLGIHDLYHWSHEELHDPTSPDYDGLVAGKSPYLNVPFFIVRCVIYLAVWSYLAIRFYGLSLSQDVEPDPAIPAKQRFTSAWGLAALAITTAFASYDFLMSTDPHWFSTIFGVYLFSGSFWVALAAMTIVGLLVQRVNFGLRGIVTTEHFHDLGKLMFGFTVFWAYIAFSQYMLIWYGNIPEETVWYRHRLEEGWEYHSLILLVFHFIAPFIILLPRATKRMRPVLAVMAVWFFVLHWFDLHWLVMPVLHHHAGFHWLDFAAWLGLFGIFAAAFMFRLGRHGLVPRNDPYLAESLHFQNY